MRANGLGYAIGGGRLRAQTYGRLFSTYKTPYVNRTPGADYGDKTDDDLKKAYERVHQHTMSQWKNGKGVVGPTGWEHWFGPFNQADYGESFERFQAFAANHDMQAEDAELQAKTEEQKSEFRKANVESAAWGMWITVKTNDPHQGLMEAQKTFEKHGFVVRDDYYSDGGGGSW